MPESTCFSTILNRLLCAKALPTHPSEQLIESSIVKFKFPDKSDPEENEHSPRGPSLGVVARLMGLDSFPAAPPKERTLGDFFRSRSVNSIDFLSHFDPVKHGSRRHRRVRTSVSFREGVDDDEYTSVVLLFEEELQGKMEEEKKRRKNLKVHEKRKSLSVSLCPVAESGEIKGRRKSVSIRIGRDLMKKDLEGRMRANLKERRPKIRGVKFEEELKGLKKKRNKNFEHKLSSDFKKIQPVAKRASPRKHLQPQIANSHSHCPVSNAAICDSVDDRVVIAEKNESEMKINENCYYKKVVEDICMLTEEDVKENWVYGMELKFETSEEICQLFGQEILEGLLTQFLDDLVLLSRQ